MENFADVKYILDSFLLIMMAALVMWMAAGFAMLEAGLTRTKNNSIVLLKNIAIGTSFTNFSSNKFFISDMALSILF